MSFVATAARASLMARLIEQILQWNGGSIVVANAETLSPHEELTQDLLSIVHCFSSRLYGLWKYKANARENCVKGSFKNKSDRQWRLSVGVGGSFKSVGFIFIR